VKLAKGHKSILWRPHVARAIGIIAAVCITFVGLEWWMAGNMPAGAVEITTAMPVAKAKGLDILLALNSTFLTYGIALLGGIGFYLNGVLKKEFELSAYEWKLLVISGGCALFSIFFGHLVPYFSSVMLANNFLDLEAGAFVWAIRLQYVSLMVSASTFLLAALTASRRVLRATEGHENASTQNPS
jgi:hypothetical protein